MRHHIRCGDVLETLKGIPDNTFHGMLSDPPYGLSFMGKDWDKVVPSKEVWAETLRVLRPGAYVLVFGGTRTFHRLAVALEDAGFEIRDCLMWLYGSGFPKSLDVSKSIDAAAGAERKVIGKSARHVSGKPGQSTEGSTGTFKESVGMGGVVTAPATDAAREWQGYGTALKPAWEPIILARKPLDGTVAANVATWGCGGLAIDASRIGREEGDVSGWSKTGSGASENVAMSGGNYARAPKPDASGRWPANLLLDEESAAVLDAEVGDRPSTLTGRALPEVRCPKCQQWEAREEDLNAEFKCPHCGERYETWSAMWRDPPPRANPSNVRAQRNVVGGKGGGGNVYGDSGGPSRFFYSAKVSSSERNAGLEAFPVLSGGEATDREEGSDGLNSPRSGSGRGGGNRCPHPTLKPIALTKYMARLLMPPTGGNILVPFSGVGSEMIGCLQAGWSRVLGIELDPKYIEIANARIAHHTK